jgi:hypothetical protein
MSLLVLSSVTSSRPMPGDGTNPPIPGDAVPMPLPIAPGEPSPDGGRIRMIAGTEASEKLVIEGGATAFGGGGDDTFVLVSSGDVEGSERLGAILDFDAGDSLDLSRLGANAKILGRETTGGETRVSIDYDGDGKEDGFVLTFEKGQVAPEPGDGGVTILPFPMPVDFDGGIGDGEFHILPYPMPGDGEVVILPAFGATSDWAAI